MQSQRAYADSWMEARIGMQVGLRHRVIQHLASGGMAHVFLAEDSASGAYAAVKVTAPDSGVPEALLAYEASMLARAQHPQIVRALEHGKLDDGSAYLLLEYVAGLDLEDWPRRSHAPLSRTRIVRLLLQLGAAVDHLHACGIVHGDIKPANVMLDANADDAIKLVDFGLAFDVRHAVHAAASGTPGYIAPEQLRGETGGPASDRFALAALAFELLTGVPLEPPPAASHVRLRDAARSQRWQRHLPGPCPKLERVFARALHEQAASRFESARAFVDALANALA